MHPVSVNDSIRHALHLFKKKETDNRTTRAVEETSNCTLLKSVHMYRACSADVHGNTVCSFSTSVSFSAPSSFVFFFFQKRRDKCHISHINTVNVSSFAPAKNFLQIPTTMLEFCNHGLTSTSSGTKLT